VPTVSAPIIMPTRPIVMTNVVPAPERPLLGLLPPSSRGGVARPPSPVACSARRAQTAVSAAVRSVTLR
jgi:hypothetical protein